MKEALLIFVGGGFGSVARYLVGKWLNGSENNIPYGTLFVNVLGCLLIGFFVGYLVKTSNASNTQSLFFATGFCGGFTTFSAFAFENHLFLKSGDYFSFVSYTLGSLILGFLAVLMGLYLVKLV